MFERGPFLEVLAQEAVGVFDGPFLRGVVGAGEKGVGLQDGGDDVVAGKLAAVVECQGFQEVFVRQQNLDDGGADDGCFERGDETCP